MNINRVRYFVAVYEARRFSDAAARLGISVQAVSKAVGELERELGVALLDRSSRSVTPTPAGTSFYRRARDVVKAFDELEEFAHAGCVVDRDRSVVRIALCSPVFQGSERLLKMFVEFVRRAVDVDMSVACVDVSCVQADLESGVFDALVTIGTYEQAGVDCAQLGTLPTGIVVGSDHPLVKKGMASLADLRSYPAGESVTIDSFNNSILSTYRSRGLTGEVVRIDENPESVHAFIAQGGYFFTAVVPIPAPAGARSALVPIDPSAGVSIPICLVTLKGRMTPELKALKGVFSKTFA